MAYKKFGTMSTAGIKFVAIVMMVMNNIDLFKDLKYVIINPHTLLYTIFFSFTIVAPVFITIIKTNMLMMELRYYGEDEKLYGKPVEIKELPFFARAGNQQMGYSATMKMLDAAQWSYYSEMIVKQIENAP